MRGKTPTLQAMSQSIHPIFQRFSEWKTLALLCAASFFLLDIVPALSPEAGFSFSFIAFMEFIVLAQLAFAWRIRLGSLPISSIYILTSLYFFRLVYRASLGLTALWGMRGGWIHTPLLGLVWYGVGTLMLHPDAYREIERYSRIVGEWPNGKKRFYTAVFFVLLTALFFALQSRNISRDGLDWIERSTKPVWHLYMREPLTIGLHRLLYLLVRPFFHVRNDMAVSFQIFPILSIAAGLWSGFWFLKIVRLAWRGNVDRVLACLLAAASGGWMILNFGHVEVYPILIAGLLPTFYFAQRYLGGQGSILPAAVGFSLTFLLHLSVGWLIPAFGLLPFMQKERKKIFPDVIVFGTTFLAIQSVFWLSLLVFCYGSDPSRMLARLHEDFNVGPDRAMFLPGWALLQGRHLWDLLNEAIYLSPPCLLLFPLALAILVRRLKKENLFWMLLAAGYLAYTFLWNPDRGYPEDWDLFSPGVPIAVFFLLHIYLPATETEAQLHPNRLNIYLAAMGTLPYAIAQILYHRLIPFSRAGFPWIDSSI
ncbi:MAG: hypothetical protein AB1656_14715 [Candidatus Omnitrophota bacterium]